MGKRLTIKQRLERKFKKAPKEIQKYQKQSQIEFSRTICIYNTKYMEMPKDIKLKPTTKIININDKIDYLQSWLNFKQRINGREKR